LVYISHQFFGDDAHHYNKIVFRNKLLYSDKYVKRKYINKFFVIFSAFGVLSVIIYYLTLAVLNLSSLAKLLQPEISGMFFHILNSQKVILKNNNVHHIIKM